MSHVDEGELHAWLDGALEELGAERAAGVRDHLRTCAACREAAVEEESVRAEAARLLALTRPPVGEPPPFETLVARARGGAGPRAARLGWAASVLIALGAGWAAREIGVGAGPSEPAFESAVPTATTAATEEAPAAPPPPAADAEPPAPSASASDAAAGPPAGEVESVEEAGGAPERPPSVAVQSAGPEAPAPAATGAGAVATRDERGAVQADRTAPAARARSGAAEERGLDAMAGEDLALRDGAATLAVPGLEVLALEWSEVAPGVRGIRVLQPLGGGDTLEIRFVPSEGAARFGADPVSALTGTPLPDGWSEVALRRGDGWLVARAPLDRARLEALVARLGR